MLTTSGPPAAAPVVSPVPPPVSSPPQPAAAAISRTRRPYRAKRNPVTRIASPVEWSDHCKCEVNGLPSRFSSPRCELAERDERAAGGLEPERHVVEEKSLVGCVDVP